MATTEVVRDRTPLPLAPIDESVIIPESVKRAAALAESFYSKAPAPPTDATKSAPPASAAAAPPAETVAPAEPETRPQPVSAEPETKPQPVSAESATLEPVLEPVHEDVTEKQWEHRFLSMQGRFQAAQRTIGSMQEQMQQLGDELVRTQQTLQNPRSAEPAQTPANLITPEDEAAYGPELIDLASRAARAAVGPEIDAIRHENAELKQRVTAQNRQDMFMALDGAVPDWRTINKNHRFISWLRLPDVYSRQVRQSLLNEAYQAADAPRVLEFFRGFLRDETATGNAETVPHAEPQPAPRIAAVPLASLAAPGRARPATGDTPGPADKPIFTRAQVRRFYADVRRGVFAGRETEKARQENEIFAAQREGRLRG
jgi:hypothetical protein